MKRLIKVHNYSLACKVDTMLIPIPMTIRNEIKHSQPHESSGGQACAEIAHLQLSTFNSELREHKSFEGMKRRGRSQNSARTWLTSCTAAAWYKLTHARPFHISSVNTPLCKPDICCHLQATRVRVRVFVFPLSVLRARRIATSCFNAMFLTCPYCTSSRKLDREANLIQHFAHSKGCAAARVKEHQVHAVAPLPDRNPYDSESDPELDSDQDDGFGPSYQPPDFVDMFEDPAPPPFDPSSNADNTPPSPISSTSSTLCGDVEEPDNEDSFCWQYPGAAQVVGVEPPPLSATFAACTSDNNPYAPYFKSRKDWDLAHWAKTRTITNEAFDSLLCMPGLIDTADLSYRNARELNAVVDRLPARAPFKHTAISVAGHVGSYDVFHCNPLDVLRDLVGDPLLDPYLTWPAELSYSDERGQHRLFSEMTSSDWMFQAQVCGCPFAYTMCSQFCLYVGSSPCWCYRLARHSQHGQDTPFRLLRRAFRIPSVHVYRQHCKTRPSSTLVPCIPPHRLLANPQARRGQHVCRAGAHAPCSSLSQSHGDYRQTLVRGCAEWCAPRRRPRPGSPLPPITLLICGRLSGAVSCDLHTRVRG